MTGPAQNAPSVASPEWLECCAVCGAGDWNGWADCPEHTALTAPAAGPTAPSVATRPRTEGGVWGSYVAYLSDLERRVAAADGQPEPRPPRSDEAVWIDPARLSGTPCVGGTRVPVYMVVEMVWASGVDEAMHCWSLSRGQVLNACWYAAAVNVVHIWRRRPPHGLALARSPWRRRWLAWAEEVKGDLWASEYGLAADPPTREETP